MTLKQQLKMYGELDTIKYFFEKKGDILPLHSHVKETQHITIVLKGSVHLIGPNLNKKLKQGEIYDYSEEEQTHEIKALKDDTIVLNITKRFNKDFETEEEKAQLEELQKKYHEEFKRQQMEQILATEKETQIIKKDSD